MVGGMIVRYDRDTDESKQEAIQKGINGGRPGTLQAWASYHTQMLGPLFSPLVEHCYVEPVIHL